MLWFLILSFTAFNYSLDLRALVVTINCPVRREGVSLGATQMFQQGRKERWSTWRHRRGLQRWAHWLGAPDKLIGSEIISTGTLPLLSIDAICLDQAFKVFCPSLGSSNPSKELQFITGEVINWCDKSHGCPAVIGVVGGWKVENFQVLIRSNPGNPNPVWKPALWGMTLHFMLSGRKDLLGMCIELKSCEASLGHQLFAGQIQQLPKCSWRSSLRNGLWLFGQT